MNRLWTFLVSGRSSAIGTLGFVTTLAQGVAAQSYARLDLGGMLEVGGEAERYARVMQIAGMTNLTPWSIQPFSPTQNRLLRPVKPNPWEKRFETGSQRVFALRPSLRLVENSAFPYQIGNGPTWAGRGVTGEVQAGGMAFAGPFHVQIAPLAFATQNASFAVAPNGLSGDAKFRDARFPGAIDAPQRFGETRYSRLVAGTSMALVDAGGVVIAASTAPNHWGPSRDYPLLLGPGAGGFPAIFLGSSAPIDLWLFKVHGRLLYGQLDQSKFSPADTIPLRLGEGVIGVIEPRGMKGLELGGARFLHRPWTDRSWKALARPFSQVVGANLEGQNVPGENQVASFFARWALPGARSEFYGEFYKEDYPGAFHQGPGSIVESPDDLSSFAFGFQHAISAGPTSITVLRGELVNSEVSHEQRIERGFTMPIPPYVHTDEVQGHTLHGLFLGSPEAYGGSGWRLGLDEFTPAGRRSVSFERSMRLDWLAGMQSNLGVHPDILYGVRFEWLRFVGARDIGLSVVPTVELNRNLNQGHDAFNLTVALSGRGWP